MRGWKNRCIDRRIEQRSHRCDLGFALLGNIANISNKHTPKSLTHSSSQSLKDIATLTYFGCCPNFVMPKIPEMCDAIMLF